MTVLLWYLARGAGLAAFLMLSVATGVGAMGARGGDPARRVVQQYVHRAAASAAVALIMLHVVTLLADPYARVGISGLLPFGSGYRPMAVTLGVVATYLLVAVALTGALRSRLAGSPRATRLWRAVHLSSYAAWALSVWHFLTAGSDTGTWWARVTLLSGVLIVGAGVWLRLSDGALLGRRGRAPAAATPGRVPARAELSGRSPTGVTR